MSGKGTIIILSVILLLGVTALVLERSWVAKKEALAAKLLNMGDVSKLELQFRGKKSLLARNGKNWKLETFDGKPAVDDRVNNDLVNHVVDLVKVLSIAEPAKLDPKDADAYGMKDPELAIRLSWQKPQPGDEAVVFGHRDLSERKSFAFFPARPSLVEVESNTVMVLQDRSALDIRDRHITTFETDDVEDLSASGKCGTFQLKRDGDRWLKSGRVLKLEHVESWLGTLLGTQYDGIVEHEAAGEAPKDSNPVCTIELGGRRNRSETVQIFKAAGTLWASNSKLPSRYHLSQGIMNALIPPQ